MSIYRHIPAPPLNQYVDFFWYYVDLSPDHDREHVLPDGTFELIVNLQETPRKLFQEFRVGAGNPTSLERVVPGRIGIMEEFSRSFLKINDKFKRPIR